jgi:hypothetical protein
VPLMDRGEMEYEEKTRAENGRGGLYVIIWFTMAAFRANP